MKNERKRNGSNNTDQNNSEFILNQKEGESLIKVLLFTLNELEHEYFTRTGFSEKETASLIQIIKNQIEIKNKKIEIPIHQITNLRQNLVEILFGIKVTDHEVLFGISEENLKFLFNSIDKMGKKII